jgi:hypothetical protein
VSAAEVRLKLIDATEFAEMLTFISDWLTGADHDQLANSFAHLWAPDSSGLSEGRTDLSHPAGAPSSRLPR